MSRLEKRDYVDSVSKNPLALFQGLLGAPQPVLSLPDAILRLASAAAELQHQKSRAGWGKSAGLIKYV